MTISASFLSCEGSCNKGFALFVGSSDLSYSVLNLVLSSISTYVGKKYPDNTKPKVVPICNPVNI